jgi:hypothetical protein
MMRRRRRGREIPFSFDSFLDIVANVVGIIIRLILVVWVGARSYSSLQPILRSAPSSTSTPIANAAPIDPLETLLAAHRLELEQVQKRLLEQLRQMQSLQEREAVLKDALHALKTQTAKLASEQANLTDAKPRQVEASQRAAFSRAELRDRCRILAEELQALERQPIAKKALHYRTPVSQPVHSEELLFECRQGKVAFIDIGALLAEVKRGLEEKGKLLRTRWQVEDVTSPIGAFRLRYVVERERELVDVLGSGTGPAAAGSYRFGLSEWQVEAVAPSRGESLQAALADGSEFRQIIDGIDPQQSAVTFWVYPDSFELFRRLRDHLYQRDVVVAGRPLPEGVPIASSRRGTVSRGQ